MSNDCSEGLEIRKAKHWPWGWGYLKPNQRRQHKMQQKRKRENVWWQIRLGIWMLRQLRQMSMGLSEDPGSL